MMLKIRERSSRGTGAASRIIPLSFIVLSFFALPFFVMAVLLSFCSEALCAPEPLMPTFRKGMTWVYKGKVEVGGYSAKKGKESKFCRNLVWRQEVLAVYKVGNVTAALLKGHPSDLWFYEDGRSPGRYLYVLVDGRQLYLLSESAVDQALSLLEVGKVPTPVLQDDYMVIGSPLKVGELYPKSSLEANCMFHWSVENRTAADMSGLKCSPELRAKLKGAPGYELIYRANTDHTIAEFVPGLGYASYSGEHHGTLSKFDMRLVEFIN